MAEDAKPWETALSRIRVTRDPNYVYASAATSELDELQDALRAPLPPAYRVFMTQFGPGGFPRASLLSPAKPIGSGGKHVTVSWKTLELRKHFGLYPHLYTNRDWLSRLVYFGVTEWKDDYVWDTSAVSATVPGDYRYYKLPRLQDDDPVLLGDSFVDFLTRVVEENASVPAGRKRRKGHPVAAFTPMALRPKQVPLQPDVRDWLSFNNNTARDLARAIRAEGRVEAFPILADALEEAGCTNADVLDSCRTGDPDIDGVWVLRVLLGQ